MTEQEEPRQEPIQVDRDAVVEMPQVTFPLRQHQFVRLTKIPSFIGIWAHSFFACTGVFLATVLARFIDYRYFGGTSTVSSLEWITLVLLCCLVLIFESINYFVPSERKKMEHHIQAYFDT